jgi:diamine N-acetyltransferase
MQKSDTNSINLRSLSLEDLDWLLQVENNPDHWEVSGTVTPFSKAVLEDYIKKATSPIHIAKQFRFVIEYNKKAVGLIDLFGYESIHKRAGVGVLVEMPYRQKGIATKALRLLIDYSFQELKLHQLYANIYTDNISSIKLFERQGFKLAGTKKDWVRLSHAYKDESIYQLLNL